MPWETPSTRHRLPQDRRDILIGKLLLGRLEQHGEDGSRIALREQDENIVMAVWGSCPYAAACHDDSIPSTTTASR